MDGTHYTILAYTIGLGLLWGYALVLWASLHRAASKAGRTEGAAS